MAIIPQKRLFGWQEADELGDLERLALGLRQLPDEELMRKLEQERAKGRGKYALFVEIMLNIGLKVLHFCLKTAVFGVCCLFQVKKMLTAQIARYNNRLTFEYRFSIL